MVSCAVCENKATYSCQRCHEIYCGVKCQRSDWPRHKFVCIEMPPLVAIQKLDIDNDNNSQSKTIKKPVTLYHEMAFMENALNTPPPPTKVFAEICTNPKLSEEFFNMPNVIENKSLHTSEYEKWRVQFTPPEKDYIDCRITHVENDGTFWVIPLDRSERLERLEVSIARSLDKVPHLDMGDITVDSLVAVTVKHKTHRACVLAVDTKREEVKLLLIDYGNIVVSSVHNIQPAVLRMGEYMAFAFHGKLPGFNSAQVDHNITIRANGKKDAEGIYNVQQKHKLTIQLNMPVQTLKQHPEVTIVKIFANTGTASNSQVALVQIDYLKNVSHLVNEAIVEKGGMQLGINIPEEFRVFHVASLSSKGYCRAFLLDYILEPEPVFLVYEIDEGRIALSSEVRRVPMEHISHPMGSFAIKMTDGQRTLEEIVAAYGRKFNIKLKLDASCDVEKIRNTCGVLMLANEQICSVRVHHFQGQVGDLGLKYWREPMSSNSMVYITRVISYDEVFISSVQTKVYRDMFSRLEEKCKPIPKSTEIPVGSIVLVICPMYGTYRAEITHIMEDRCGVLNIDVGSTHVVPISTLRMSCRFIENLPISLVRTKLKTICDLPKAAVPGNNEALQKLKSFMKKREKFKALFVDNSCDVVDLISMENDFRSSLSDILLPKIFVEAKKPDVPNVNNRVQIETTNNNKSLTSQQLVSVPSLPPSPTSSVNNDLHDTIQSEGVKSFEIHYVDELKKNPVPVGKDLVVLTLNVEGLHKTGYLTACYIPNEKMAENFQNLLNLVSQHGKHDYNEITAYAPAMNELCLALFEEDNTWYRGVCLSQVGKSAKIHYCDFGNEAEVSIFNIKPISNELLHPVFATKCYVNGFSKTKNFKVLEDFLSRHSKVDCDVTEGPEPHTRNLTVHNLDAILAGVIS